MRTNKFLSKFKYKTVPVFKNFCTDLNNTKVFENGRVEEQACGERELKGIMNVVKIKDEIFKNEVMAVANLGACMVSMFGMLNGYPEGLIVVPLNYYYFVKHVNMMTDCYDKINMKIENIDTKIEI